MRTVVVTQREQSVGTLTLQWSCATSELTKNHVQYRWSNKLNLVMIDLRVTILNYVLINCMVKALVTRCIWSVCGFLNLCHTGLPGERCICITNAFEIFTACQWSWCRGNKTALFTRVTLCLDLVLFPYQFSYMGHFIYLLNKSQFFEGASW